MQPIRKGADVSKEARKKKQELKQKTMVGKDEHTAATSINVYDTTNTILIGRFTALSAACSIQS